MPGEFELKRSGAQYLFNLRASGNSETILTSERYTDKATALGGIQAVKTNAPTDGRYERKMSSDDKHYFVLKGANGEPIGTSERYSSAAAREKGIAAVKSDAPNARLDDQT